MIELKAWAEGNSNNDAGESIVAEKDESKKNAVFAVWGVLLQYTRDVQSMTIPAYFCVMHYVNDWRYLPAGEAPDREQVQKEGKSNVEFNQNKSPCSAISFTSYKLLTVTELWNMKYDDN